ncbi:MAG: FAD-dependent oxidoreductase [Gammaproteobacteria bacterium]|nr:FAD-dependent oxidoreductase [Gammaproteobacteria bacterium]
MNTTLAPKGTDDTTLEQSDFPSLFSPIAIGSRTAKNRIMRVATTANLADKNRVGPRILSFYRALAKGGVGTIVTEALRTQPLDPFGPGALVIFERDAIDGLRQLADVCHAEGALLIGQLNMGGRQHLAARVIPYSVGPSAIACPRSGGVPHELTAREIEDHIETYVMCAVHCIEAGMDGVEIHGAQGHLIQQFVSPYTNQRTDEWGGSLENRLRFPTEILQRVRARTGRGIVGYRMGVEEFTASGLSIDDTVDIARRFVDAGIVDYLSLSQGNFNSIETHLPDRHEPILAYRSLHARFKAVAPNIPVIASTRIQGPEQAESVIGSGEADMVGLCRALLADPDWPRKALTHRATDIRRCIACNQCWAWISTGEPIGCATNPVVGREYLWPKLERDRAEFSRHVVVIGGGPAGLEAARVAQARGHRVTLLEKESTLGGRLRTVHEVPYFEEMGNLLDFLIPQVTKQDVCIRLNTPATASLVLELKPDDIVIAAGATPYAPELASDGSIHTLTADGNIPLPTNSGKHVVIMDEDGYYWTSMLIESVIAQGKIPVVVSRFFEVCREVPVVSRINIIRQIDKHAGLTRPNMYVAGIAHERVELRHYMTDRSEFIDDVNAVVWAGAALSNGELSTELLDAGFAKQQIHLIGDAFAPRRLAQALGEGHRVGREIGTASRM